MFEKQGAGKKGSQARSASKEAVSVEFMVCSKNIITIKEESWVNRDVILEKCFGNCIDSVCE